MFQWCKILVSSLSMVLAATSAFAGVEARLSHFGETLHLELRGQDTWVYDVQKKGVEKGKILFSLKLPILDSASKQLLLKAKAPGLEEVRIDNPIDQSQVVYFKFKSVNTEHFDYLTDKPSRLVVDFYSNEEPAKKATASTPATEKRVTTVAKAGSGSKGRKPAGDALVIAQNGNQGVDLGSGNSSEAAAPQAGIFDGADPNFGRFSIQDFEVKESAIIGSRQKVYVDFPMLHLQPDELQALQLRAPVYQIDPKENEENKQARLLLTLRKNNRPNVFFKTAEWFFQKYPKSEYAEILKFMWGDILYDEWKQSHKAEDLDRAILKYQEAMNEFPQSPLSERTQLLIAYSQLERGDALAALQFFEAHARQFPDSGAKDLIGFAKAEAYFILNRGAEAKQIYDDLAKNAKRPQDRIRAEFLKPDIDFKNQKYEMAINEYQRLQKKYPLESADYPSAAFNMAAAQFRQGQFRQSLQDYLDFVKRFPSHPYSGYALTRVGELLEILGADPSRVMGAYLETYFRYGATPGAAVARLRMLSARMKGMKPQELDKAVVDIMKLAKESSLPKMEQFATIMVADGYHDRGDYERSLKLLVEFYQKYPTTADLPLLTQRIERNIADEIHDQVEKEDYMKALKTHQNYSESWLKDSRRVDVQYDLGRAFEQAGVGSEAEKLYRDSLNRILATRGTAAEKELGVFEKVPSVDEILLRMASVNLNMDHAQLAFENLKEIKKPEQLTQRQQIERVLLAAKLYDLKGEPQTAIRYLTELVNAWKGIPALAAEPYFNLGQMEEKLRQSDAAIASYRRVDELMKDSGKVSEKTHALALENMARLQVETKQQSEAAATYEHLLSLYEEKMPMASLRYKLGKIYFDKGELQKASDTWGKLDKQKSSFWANLANENLKASKWNDDYKKYLKRLPAGVRDAAAKAGNSNGKEVP